ncbi:MAG: DUF2723 domain-containing protein [Gammaproteobacteria bacterium]|nr:DUF2723 domain-containing protein [Gammaproteobacteria bacterium]MXW09576.1 DUF2723 domain-containing protein [Gammaproteobacteria bacterium]MYC51738.1 DUF2723 domain-containing protein [Gammaproteobacteria bacterium]
MNEHRPPYLAAVIAAAAIFLLYVVTLAPTTAFWDTSEYIATGYILGIPHPPGNPLFVVLARVWIVLLSPLGLPVAVRVNLLAALTSAAASGFFFLVAHRIAWGLLGDHRRALVGAAASALLGATAYTVWNQSVVNEKVYTVSVLVIAAVTWLAVRWRDRRGEPGSGRLLLVAGYLMILGWSNHTMSLLPVPALGLMLLMTAPRVLLRRDLWMRALPLVVVGLSFNVFLPIRAAQRPVINEGDPLCESPGGVAAAVLTAGNAGCPRLASVLQRDQYAPPPLGQRQSPVSAQFQNYFQYFDWQWARGLDPSPVPSGTRAPVTGVFLALGLFGLLVIRRTDRHLFAYMATLTVTVTVALVIYLNFKYGYSLAPEIADPDLHEVRERDYFYIAGFIVWGVLAGIGLTGIWHMAARGLRRTSPVTGGRVRVAGARLALGIVTFLAALIALTPLAANWRWASRAGDYAARDWAYDLLQSVEPYSVLFTNGDNDTFPLWYLQEVEGIRRDVTVIVGQYLFTQWYPRQLQELTRPDRQRPFEPDERVVGLYPAREMPSRPVLSLAPEEIDRIQGAATPQDANVRLGPVVVQYPRGTYLDRGDQVALAIIRDSIAERPIYFAWTGGIIRSLGLHDFGVRQGLATRLVLRDIETDGRFVRTDPALGGEWVDLERTRRLSSEVMMARSLRYRDVWADRTTLNIPYYYFHFSRVLFDRGSAAGLPADELARYRADMEAFGVTMQGGYRVIPEAEPGAG